MLYLAAANSVDSTEHWRRVANWMLVSITWATLLIAALGAYKFVQFLHGKQLGFVADAASGRYPWGTSLVSDYNMFSLTMLTGLLSCCVLGTCAKGPLQRAWYAVAFIFIFLIGFLAGSRRFWVIAPIAIVAYFVVANVNLRKLRPWRMIGYMVVIVATVAGALSGFLRGKVDVEQLLTTGWNLQARLMTLINPDSGFGFSSRISRWNLAFDLLNGPTVIIGRGFDYLQLYGCRFAGCQAVDYPHNLLLSSLLYGGVVGFAAVALLTLCLLNLAFRVVAARSSVLIFGVMLLAYLPFVFVSSNSVFSVKSFLGVGILCAMSARCSSDA
jgi:hypothetical protein